MNHVARKITGLAALSLTVATPAFAQIVDPARPDTVERQYRIQEQRPMVGGAPIITVPDQGKPPIPAGVKFTLKSIKLENATVYTAEDLDHIWDDYIGKQITLSELTQIANDITSYYRNHGYILTRAVIPPQRAQGGNIRIRIVEGFVDNVKFQGDAAEDEQVRAYANKIQASKPLDAKALERYLLLMDDLPGIEARAILQPSPTTPGASEVIVTITRKSFEFAGTLDNRGSRFLGPEQLGLTFTGNNLIGLNDQTQLRLVNTIADMEELKYIEVRHEEQIGNEGTKMVFAANFIETKPGHTLDPLDIEGESASISVGASHPLLRSRRANWFVNGDITARNVDVDSLDLPLYFDKTRVLALGTAYDFVDDTSAINRMDVRVAQGIAIGTGVEAQPHSRANGEPGFTKMNLRASRIQPIDGPWSVYGVAAGQYSLDPLLASEEFALGGAEFGSAFDNAELTGDHGAAARLELQYNETAEFFSQYQLYGFYDIGRVWNIDRNAGEEAHDSLSSTGLGVRFNIDDQFSGGVEGALPLVHKVNAYGQDGGAPRLFMNLQYRY